MVITDADISGLIGPVVGGLLVIGATFLTDRFNRSRKVKERHLNEHKENMKILIRYLQNIMPEVNFLFSRNYYLFSFSPREPDLSKFEYTPSFETAFFYEQQNESLPFHRVDGYLYNDMQKHWVTLYNKLIKAEKEMRLMGASLLTGYTRLFREIYNLLNEVSREEYGTIHNMINRQYSFDDNIDGFCQQNSSFANALFNLVLGNPKVYWLNLYNEFNAKNGIFEDLNIMVKVIDSKIPDVISDIKMLNGQLNILYNDLLLSLEEQSHLNFIKGHCESIELKQHFF